MKLAMKKLFILTLMVLTILSVATQANAQKSIFDLSSTSLFSNDSEFIDVEEAFKFDFEQNNNKVTIKFEIKEGYYLYRHQFKFPVKNAKIAPVELPLGIEHEDEFFGVQQIYELPLSFDINILAAGENASLTVRYQGCAKKGLCYPPTTKKISLPMLAASTSNNTPRQAVLSALNTNATANTPASAKINNSNKKIVRSSEQNRLADMLQQGSLWLTLIAFFVGGLLLSFTPCVFPMYPILTGIIVGHSNNSTTPLTTKKAFTLSFFYVQGMAITYTLLGVVVALAGAQFQAAFQHPVVLIALSVLFIFLALSMFGLFNLALPSSWQNKLNFISSRQRAGSITGVVIMGIISGLVASPCTTAPLTGALLYISQSGDVVLGASALYALSLGMGLPLLILGSSGGKLLPKAGNWMNVIKNIFGLLLLAVPIFLLERIIPELATQWLWTILILASASYFYVSNQNSASNNKQGFWYGLRSLLIFVVLFFGANQLYQLTFPNQNANNVILTNKTETLFIHVNNLSELQQAVKNANRQGKTLMVDFYANWCVACKEFEKYTFNKPQVQQALANTVLVQIDLTDTSSPSSKELMSHFKIFGLPSILFFDLQGSELSKNRVTGFMDADEFAQHINTILN
jgi:thioredoxin:protein disulfide reductase